MLYKNQQLENVGRLNPRLKGVLGGVVSLGLLVVMSWLSFFGFDSAGLLKSDVIATPSTTSTAATDANTATPVAIKSFTPMTGPVGTTVAVVTDRTPTDLKVYFTGANGSRIQSDGLETVYVGGVATLKAKVPAGAVTGHIAVTSNNLTSESQSNFTVVSAPNTATVTPATTSTVATSTTQPTTITGFTPAEGDVDTPVYVALSNLGSSALAYKIYFASGNGGRVEAINPEIVLMGANRVLKVKVPVGSSTGKLTVITNGVTAESQWDFKITGSAASTSTSQTPVTITTVTPAHAAVGDYIEIAGQGFAPRADDNLVEFVAPNDATVRSRQVKIVSIGGQQVLRVRVPEGALTGRVTVTVAGRTAMSESDLTIGTTAAKGGATGAGNAFTVQELSTYDVKPGDQLLVAGQGIARSDTVVKIGGQPIQVVNRSKTASGDLLLTVVTPTARSGFLTVELGGEIAIHPKQVTVTGSTGGAPLIDITRNQVSPKVITPTTSALSLYTFVSDPDGAEDIVSVTADLSAIGGRPLEALQAGPVEGIGRLYSLEKTSILDVLEDGKEYTIPLIATDKVGLSDRSQITFCVGACPTAADLTGGTEAAHDAVSSDGASAAASVEPAIVRPAAPTGVTAIPDQGFIRLSWDAPAADSGITGYYVYYGTTHGAYLHRVSAGLTNLYFLSGLDPAVTYYLTVIATDSHGVESAPSNEVTAVFPYKTTDAGDGASQDLTTPAEATHGAAPDLADNTEYSYAADQSVAPAENSVDTLEVASIEPPHATARTHLTASGPAEDGLIALMVAVLIGGVVVRKLGHKS